MDDAFGHRVTKLGALADPVRRALYRFVADQPGAVSRDQAADGIDVPRHTAKFHLDRLVDEGLLVTEFRRLTGRTGPGAGRPAKLYRRSRKEVAVSLPSRRYDLAGDVLADAVERSLGGTAMDVAVREAADGRRRPARPRRPAPRTRGRPSWTGWPGCSRRSATSPGSTATCCSRTARSTGSPPTTPTWSAG